MAKGYWIARVDVHNDEGTSPMRRPISAIFKKFGGRLSCVPANSPPSKAKAARAMS